MTELNIDQMLCVSGGSQASYEAGREVGEFAAKLLIASGTLIGLYLAIATA